MLSPIGWIKPRLKSLCVAFGAADMTLVILSTLCWYFFFNVGFEAQHLHSLYNAQSKKDPDDEDGDDTSTEVIYKLKEERTPEDLRLERTIRACGLHVMNKDLDTNSVDSNYAGPAAFVGASMGSFFILGALLLSLNVVDHPAARKTVCAVALFGQSVSCFFLLIGVISLLGNDGLCPTEYYYEYFQPVLYLVVFSIIFISTYKAYEMTILAFYMGDQTSELNQEKKTIKRLSGGGTGTLESDLKKLKISVKEQAGQGDSSVPQRSRRKSDNSNDNYDGGGEEGAEELEMRMRPNTATDNSADMEAMESRRKRRSRDDEDAKRRPQTTTDNSSREPNAEAIEARKRRRKSREEAEMRNRPDTATTATDNSTRNTGDVAEAIEMRRRRREEKRKNREEAEMKRREEEEMKNKPDTATATDNSARNPEGGGDDAEDLKMWRQQVEEGDGLDGGEGGDSKPKRRSRSRDRGDGSEAKRSSRSRDRGEEGRKGHSKSKGHKEGAGGDDESELKRKQKAMECERKRANGENVSDRSRKQEKSEAPKDGGGEHHHERRRKHTTLKDKDKSHRDKDKERSEFKGHRKQRQSEDYHRDWEREAKKANRRHPAGIPQGGEDGDGAKALVPM